MIEITSGYCDGRKWKRMKRKDKDFDKKLQDAIDSAEQLKVFTRDDYLMRFSELTNQMLETTRKKNNDYGGHTDPFKNFRRHGAFGVLVRMDDKYSRLHTVIAEQRQLQVADETILDTLIDIANYAIILRIMLEQKVEPNI